MTANVLAIIDSTPPCTTKAQQEYICTSGQSTKMHFEPTSSVIEIA